ncbi:MAG: hypothetical protein AAF304_10465 [Pseudomonadota bacterium]
MQVDQKLFRATVCEHQELHQLTTSCDECSKDFMQCYLVDFGVKIFVSKTNFYLEEFDRYVSQFQEGEAKTTASIYDMFPKEEAWSVYATDFLNQILIGNPTKVLFRGDGFDFICNGKSVRQLLIE